MSKTLWQLEAGETCRINNYGEDLDENYSNRLKDLGFHVGQEIECLQSPSLGAPKIFKLNNSIYALDNEVAKEIHCE